VEPPHLELIRLAVALRIKPPNQPPVVEDGQHEVPELPLGLGDVHLELVAESEQPLRALAVIDERVERRQQRRPRLNRRRGAFKRSGQREARCRLARMGKVDRD
jgi:hypothetical protein